MAIKNFVEELEWRGMIHSIMPGTQEQLQKEMSTAYVGIDPTADSLHIGHLVSVMILKHFQMCGHRPIALVGGATGMIGDPSGKSQERNLLDEKTLRHNQEAIKKQLAKLLDFESDAPNAAMLVNNYDWMKGITFLDFIRDIGKLITVNYMMAKDSVKKRFNGEGEGMSFTEFTYQLVQAYDFLHLYETVGCKLQLGGADQWGNITTGTELIRRKAGGEAFALTCPLLTNAAGTKFGKTESGNVWLDPRYTSPYKFYQFWLNTSDEDAKRYIKIFTLLDKQTIDDLIAEHDAAPHLRILQKRLAQEVTVMIHSQEEYEKAVEASNPGVFGDVVRHGEGPESSRSFGVHAAFGDHFPVEMGEFFEIPYVLQHGGAAHVGGLDVLVVGNGFPVFGGQSFLVHILSFFVGMQKMPDRFMIEFHIVVIQSKNIAIQTGVASLGICFFCEERTVGANFSGKSTLFFEDLENFTIFVPLTGD